MKNNDDILRTAVDVIPDKRQIEWQRTGACALISFGINTFTNSEQGSGGESAELFNPESLDARQWAKTMKLSELHGLILTVKHYDGFCLWPSKYTDHSVKGSPWKDGEGDLVREVSVACREKGLKFGIYFPVLDRHETSFASGKQYNDFIKNQLRELLTGYGKLFCIRLDGALEERDGRSQEIDWYGIYKLIRELQPEAVISLRGPDVRWCGNYAGVCRRSEWSVVPERYSHAESASREPAASTKKNKKSNIMDLDLGSRKALKNAGRLVWSPAEVCIPLRKGWFYHPADDYTVKPLSKLLNIYYNSDGANAAFLLGISPNSEGIIPQKDVETLLSFGAQLSIDFKENLADDSVMTGSGCLDSEHEPQKALSHDLNEYWHSGFDPEKPELILDLGDEYDIDKVVFREHIESGQHVEEFTVYAELDGKWKKLTEGTVIGCKRVCRFRETRMRRIRLVIESTRSFAAISAFEAY